MDAAYRKVATTDEFAPGEVKPLRLPGARVALYNSGGTFYAIGDACTHAGGILSSGEFGGEGRTEPVPVAALLKFDDVAGVDRIYDNGSIAVYDLNRLTHTEPEFRSLESYLPPLFEVTSRTLLVNTLSSGETTEYRMLALAVHGTDDATDGWGQSKILPDGTELTAAEAMALSFPQLCVLASCHSSVRLRNGVELAGFPLALFARGATTVVGSLHEIDDEATSQIMQRFWKHMGDGTDPVRALRYAKLDWLTENPDRRLIPRLWGGLVALGGAHF